MYNAFVQLEKRNRRLRRIYFLINMICRIVVSLQKRMRNIVTLVLSFVHINAICGTLELGYGSVISLWHCVKLYHICRRELTCVISCSISLRCNLVCGRTAFVRYFDLNHFINENYFHSTKWRIISRQGTSF